MGAEDCMKKVYVLMEEVDLIGVYQSREYAQSDANLYGLRNYTITETTLK